VEIYRFSPFELGIERVGGFGGDEPIAPLLFRRSFSTRFSKSLYIFEIVVEIVDKFEIVVSIRAETFAIRYLSV